MLGIDITLEQLDVTPKSNIDVTTLSIDLLNLQAINISAKEVPKNWLPASTGSRQTFISTQTTKSGRGAFAIIDGSKKFLKVVCESVISVKAILLARKVQEDPFEYARGSVDERFFNQCSTPSDDHLFKDSYLKMKAYSKLFEKIDVYGRPAIVAHFPSVTVNLVHSVGVGSNAGSVTISITIIDLAKASFTKTIGATGRIIQERPKSAVDRAISGDMKPFNVEDFRHQKLNSTTASRVTSQNASDRVSGYKIKKAAEPSDFSLDSLSLLLGKAGKLNYDSDDSVSMDGFFEAINAKRNKSTNENEDNINECEEINESNGINLFNSYSASNRIDNRISIMKNTSSFKQANFIEAHTEKKTVSNQNVRKIFQNSGNAKNTDLNFNRKSSFSKNSGSGGGRVPGERKSVKPDKEWDSTPMGRTDYSMKPVTKPLISSENTKIQRENSMKVRNIDMKLCPRSTSTRTTLLSNMPGDNIDKDLEKASNQIFNSFKSSVKVTNSIDIDKLSLISSNNYENVPPVVS